MRSIALTALAVACTPRPDPVPADVARAIALADAPFAEIVVPNDSRGGVFPPDAVALGPWTVVSGSTDVQRWETPLPVKLRSLFYYTAPDGMRLLDDTGARVRSVAVVEDGEAGWAFDAQSLRIEAPMADPPVPSRVWTLNWPVAQAREASMNFAFSGADDPASFARASLQDGGVSRTGVLVPAPGSAAWDLTIPPAAELSFAPSVADPEIADGPPSNGVGFTWEVEVAGAVTVVWRGTRDPSDAFDDVRVDLSRWAGQSVRLRLRTDPLGDPLRDYAFVGDPIVASRQEDPRRVVVLFVDTLRPDHLGLHGYERETSPNLDAWAQDAAVFEQARSIAPWTLPTARTLVTGRQPEHYAVSETLQERLRQEGWATGMIAGNVYLTSNFDMHRDWGMHRVRHKPPAEEQVDLALEWLERHEGEDALLLLHFMDVHLPYQEPAAYRELWAGEPPAGLGSAWFHRGTVLRSPIGPEEQQYIRDRYDGAIRYVDDEIARLLAVLDDDDIVVFLSDHGEEFWEHDDFEHGHTLYDEVLRVPLVVRAPGLPPARVAEPVSLLDVVPTILDLLDVEPSAPLDGTSLVPAALDAPGAREALMVRDQAFGRMLYGETRWGTLRGTAKYTTMAGSEAVRDLAADPGEKVDRLRSAPELAPEFRERLATALGTEVRLGFRLLANDLGAFPPTDLVARVRVPGGIAAAFVGDDPTGGAGAEVVVEGDTAVVTWPRRYRMMGEVFLVPALPYEEAARGLTVEATFADLAGDGRLEGARPYRSDEPGLLTVQIGGRTVRVHRAVIPLPYEHGQALEGFDDELSTMLQAMGYAVGGGDGGSE